MAQFPARWIRDFAQDSGDEYPGRAACAALASRLREGTLSSPEDIEYLAGALEAIADGRDANTALRLGRDSKRPTKHARDAWIFQRVEEFRDAGMTITGACEQVGLELQKWGEFPNRAEAPADDVAKIYRRERRARAEEDE